MIHALLPTAILWVNGGFVTHKPWAAPDDVDVCVLTRASERQAVPDATINPLLTQVIDGKKVRAMSGAVDAFVALRGHAQLVTFYDQYWRNIRLEDKSVHPTLKKGYLEVRP